MGRRVGGPSKANVKIEVITQMNLGSQKQKKANLKFAWELF
jgi:hypothetical protein